MYTTKGEIVFSAHEKEPVFLTKVQTGRVQGGKIVAIAEYFYNGKTVAEVLSIYTGATSCSSLQ